MSLEFVYSDRVMSVVANAWLAGCLDVFGGECGVGSKEGARRHELFSVAAGD